MTRYRRWVAGAALAIPALAFALNALISFRERRVVEPLDIPAAIAFAVLAAYAVRGSRLAMLAGVALVAAYLATTIVGGPTQLAAYWLIALVAVAQGLVPKDATAPA